MTRAGCILLIILAAAGAYRPAQAQEFRVKPDHTVVFGGQHLLPDYLPEFTVLFSATDPQLKMRPAGIPDVQYNVATWLSDCPDLNRTDRRADQSGDGFDDEILEGSVESRTADIFNSGRIIVIRPSSHRAEGGHKVTFGYPENALFRITAELTADTTTGHPLLTYRLTAKTGGWYSVGFTGFAGTEPERTDEIWQPLIWQEKRFPDKSYLTLAFRCPVPSAFITSRNTTYGILAHPAEFPFDPLPTAANSRFGVAVRDRKGLASPMLFAPVPGGIGSETAPGGELTFSALLCGQRGDTTDALRNVAENLFGFTTNRNNALGSLNETIENMISYVLGPYSRFLDNEKGCTLFDGCSGRSEKRFKSQSAGNRRPERQPENASRKGAAGIRIRAVARKAALLCRFDTEHPVPFPAYERPLLSGFGTDGAQQHSERQRPLPTLLR